MVVKKLGYTPLKTMTILTVELWWGRWKTRSSLGFALATDPTLTKYCGPLQSFLKFWLCSLQRLFEKPQLFHLKTEVIVKQGFGVLCGSN